MFSLPRHSPLVWDHTRTWTISAKSRETLISTYPSLPIMIHRISHNLFSLFCGYLDRAWSEQFPKCWLNLSDIKDLSLSDKWRGAFIVLHNKSMGMSFKANGYARLPRTVWLGVDTLNLANLALCIQFMSLLMFLWIDRVEHMNM